MKVHCKDLSRGTSYNITCVSSEDSDQLVHPCSLIRIFTGHSVGSKDPKRLQADSEDSDQTARMRRLI